MHAQPPLPRVSRSFTPPAATRAPPGGSHAAATAADYSRARDLRKAIRHPSGGSGRVLPTPPGWASVARRGPRLPPPEPAVLEVDAPAPIRFPARDVDAPRVPGSSSRLVLTGDLRDPAPTQAQLLADPVYRGYNYRRSRIAPGHCHGGFADAVWRAFRIAYQLIRTADVELRYWFEENHAGVNLDDAREFWRYSATGQPECTLEYWFGDADAEGFGERFGTVYNTIKSWSRCFRRGFYYPIYQPVYIRCRGDKDLGDTIAVHASLNVITLYADWFTEGSEWWRALVLLHEMGHLSGSSLFFMFPGFFGLGVGQGITLTEGPRDRRNSRCDGWSENKCYAVASDANQHSSRATLINTNQIPPNPRRLVEDFEAGSKEARRDMLGNIDNYVCYMQNRWVDRDYRRVQV